MSLELKQTFLGPPVPSASRGFGVQIDVHKDGDTVAYGNSKFVITRSLTPGGPVGKKKSPILTRAFINFITMQSSKENMHATAHFFRVQRNAFHFVVVVVASFFCIRLKFIPNTNTKLRLLGSIRVVITLHPPMIMATCACGPTLTPKI